MGEKKRYLANSEHKKALSGCVILGKTDFKSKYITGDKEGHHIIIKGSII